MTGWCQVRRKGGQEEKVVSAVSRGWEEYKKKFPHLAHEQRQGWSTRGLVRMWMAGGDESVQERQEEWYRNCESKAYTRKVEKWLSGGGGQE